MTAPVLLITGATCAMKDVKQKMKELNVQLDNLCQVLFSCQADANTHTHTHTHIHMHKHLQIFAYPDSHTQHTSGDIVDVDLKQQTQQHPA